MDEVERAGPREDNRSEHKPSKFTSGQYGVQNDLDFGIVPVNDEGFQTALGLLNCLAVDHDIDYRPLGLCLGRGISRWIVCSAFHAVHLDGDTGDPCRHDVLSSASGHQRSRPTVQHHMFLAALATSFTCVGLSIRAVLNKITSTVCSLLHCMESRFWPNSARATMHMHIDILVCAQTSLFRGISGRHRDGSHGCGRGHDLVPRIQQELPDHIVEAIQSAVNILRERTLCSVICRSRTAVNTSAWAQPRYPHIPWQTAE
ncbi:hypothetical protein NEOLEDRAFT_1140692 [Neolentinus lepideus HHB14362 ss-1]|uniref:Uncharacterized protein n=1 Tax=Neolentinus lepideus HHB14362 ss-1 TaxID=1314782 RepID=A0A165P2D5_9AGAM|nr:hypothetical protein NEOLEDRAFT_1140692 [Neolentinus lepideus HHB14362 ss-1]